jgi:hypothetical protein
VGGSLEQPAAVVPAVPLVGVEGRLRKSSENELSDDEADCVASAVQSLDSCPGDACALFSISGIGQCWHDPSVSPNSLVELARSSGTTRSDSDSESPAAACCGGRPLQRGHDGTENVPIVAVRVDGIASRHFFTGLPHQPCRGIPEHQGCRLHALPSVQPSGLRDAARSSRSE